MHKATSIKFYTKDGSAIKPVDADLLPMVSVFNILERVTQLDTLADESIIGYGEEYTPVVKFRGAGVAKDCDDLIVTDPVYNGLLRSVQARL